LPSDAEFLVQALGFPLCPCLSQLSLMLPLLHLMQEFRLPLDPFGLAKNVREDRHFGSQDLGDDRLDEINC
jgi:hypothetical protein